MKILSMMIFLALLVSMPGSPITAESEQTPNMVAATQKIEKPITVKVNGLVCAFCAQGIKKRFMSLPEVASVQVSLAKKTVVILVKPNATLSDTTIQNTVREAGYNVVRIER